MSIARIVVAADGSEPSRAAVVWAANLARSLDASVLVVYALEVELHQATTTVTGAMYLRTPIDDAELHARAEHSLNTLWSQPLRDSHVQYHTRVDDTTAVEAILQAASDEGADLIVMGARGRRWFIEPPSASVADQVSHRAPVPVVVVPPLATTARDDAALLSAAQTA